MNEKALVIQQKAFSLRDYLNEGKVKESLASSLPQWLSIDRLLRVFMGAVNKNPSLLDCTRESIVISCMQCAQLGLEPILGRAWLVPYNNNKNINGKWVKVLECQMQPGYQGLIDLARRSNTISDVYGLNVFDNDDFDLSFGTDRKIHHKPWYMSKGIDGPGEFIGAYVVWLLKDGTKHPEFMHISDIHKRRAISKAYQSAIKHDKTDTPWLQWPEDMNLKTVIKHSSKMVPASIEFMQAVEVDNASEMGKGPYLPYPSDMFLPNIEEPEEPGKEEDNFQPIHDELISKGATKDDIEVFVDKVANENNLTQIEVQASAIDDRENFIKAVLNSVKLKNRMDEGDREAEGYSSLNEEEKLQQGQAKLEEKRKQEQEGKGKGDGLEKVDMIEWLKTGRPSSSIRNAEEWLKAYEANMEEIEFLEDHALRDQLRKKKEKTIQYLKEKQRPKEAPQSPGSQEQAERKEAFIDYCFEADKKVQVEAPDDQLPTLIEAVLAVEDFKDLDSVLETQYGSFKASLRSEAARRGVTIEA